MSAAALDRQIRPIYDALDTGSNKSAIVACNKLLKKHPKNELIKSLKALALIRSQKVEESLVLCDEVLEMKPTDDGVLTAMMHVLRGLGRHNDMVTMFEEAYKKLPANEDLGAQTFFANVRANHWKSAHQIATRMFKQFQDDRYLYWSVICAVLQAKDIATPPTMRPILYKLAHRLLSSSPTPSYVSADRFHLHLSILHELDLFEEAEKLLDSDVGKSICATNLSCNEVRRDIWLRQGRTEQEGERAKNLIVEKKDRNWLEFLAVLDATLPPLSSSTASENLGPDPKDKVSRTQELFSTLEEQDGLRDRSASLALLELEKRARAHGLSQDPSRMLTLMKHYFEKFGDKACCFEDLKPFLGFEKDDLTQFISFLEAVPTAFTTVSELQRLINSYKLLRYMLPEAEITAEKESERVAAYTKYYFEGLPLGASLPPTELQHADDLVLLAGNAYVNLWKLTNNNCHLLNAVYLLEFALTKSKQSFLTRLILMRIYRLLGAPALALEHYRVMQIKQVQHDTLSHLILSRASTFSLASTGDLTLATECLESTQIYLSNSQETGDFVVRAFTAEKYSQIPEFIIFEDQLDNSLQRDTVKIEHLRMRLTHEAITSDIIDMELIELKFIFDRTHYDNRDFAILPNYQPKNSQGLHEQTLLFGKPEGPEWLSAFLKVYIRAFQQASDLDDTVEEKLLIGDRPKQTADFDKKLSLRDRLLQRSPAEATSLTPDEAQLIEYAHALADWLEPYHNYARPPPSVVLAEAAKQTELKTGHPLKGIEIPATNGSNGQHKKDEEPPVVHEPPQTVLKYFDAVKARFDEAQSKSSPSELLHVATLAQEAYLLLVTETLRFKSPSVVKINKLSALVTSFKALRTNALAVLKDISASLVKRGGSDGSSESRSACVDACSPALTSQVDHDFVFYHAKKITDSRRKVLDGVGKGIARLCSAYAT
ncbi:actin cytoskeleton organization protein [Flammula alnicola]|nr:actin cytoskeleton organization protein [Flammula alnicola]